VLGFGHVAWAEFALRRDGTLISRHWGTAAGRMMVSATTKDRPDKYSDQATAAHAVAKAINASKATHYRAEPEVEGGHESYADAELVSEVPGERSISLQMRHFHDDIAANLRGRNLALPSTDLSDIGDRLQRAIDAKADVDPALKARAHLVLISPVPLGPLVRASVAAKLFESRGFSEIWLAPSTEPPFSLLR